jgi:hypothetical protein
MAVEYILESVGWFLRASGRDFVVAADGAYGTDCFDGVLLIQSPFLGWSQSCSSEPRHRFRRYDYLTYLIASFWSSRAQAVRESEDRTC